MQRINNFLKVIRDMDCDCAIIHDRANVRYLSGFTGSAGFLFISESKLMLVTDFRYIEQATEQAKGFTVVNISGFDMDEQGKAIKCAAFEDETISYRQYQALKKSFACLKPLGSAVMDLRKIKTPEEVELIRTAEKIGDSAFEHILNIIKPGMTEKQVAREIDFYMLTHGADALSFDTIVATGAHGSMPHAVPTDTPIKDGDLVVMDFGCVYKGYCGDMTRTIGISNVSEEFRQAYDTVLTAQLKSLEKIKSGVTCADIHNTAFEIIDHKYKGMFGHALGHGVGLEVHEQPTFAPKSNYPIEEGVVISVEPGVYIPGKCGVRIEDLVLITKDGYENLTHSSKDFILI